MCWSKDMLRLLLDSLGPAEKVRLSRCSKEYYRWLKDFINIDEWNLISAKEGMKAANLQNYGELEIYFSNKFLHSETYKLQPKPYDQSNRGNLIKIIQNLLFECDSITIGSDKAKNAHRIMEWISRNLWMITKYENFRVAVQKKLVEFQTDNAAENILRDFGWMITADFQDKTVTYTRYGRKIKAQNYK